MPGTMSLDLNLSKSPDAALLTPDKQGARQRGSIKRNLNSLLASTKKPMSAQLEQWRVHTPEGVFETDLETLKQWIAEGSVLPTDKVSKGKLSWIDAGRAPMLKAAFQSEVVVPPLSIASSTLADPIVPQDSPQDAEVDHHDAPKPEPHLVDLASLPVWCYSHQQVTPQYICLACNTAACESCVKYERGIPACPKCEAFCKPYEEVRQHAELVSFQRTAFGIDDFVRALRYPLEHKVALVCGALLYGILLLGGFRGSVIAFVIMFGCMSHVISQVAWGRLKRSFMPDFSEFSLWDDLAVPIFLGLGITIVSWGPVIVLLVAIVFGLLSAGPGARPLSPQQAQANPPPVTAADLAPLTDPNADPKKLEEANNKLNQLRPGSEIAREAEESKKTTSDPNPSVTMLMGMMGGGMLLALLLLVGVAWGIFYYPMALAVAGYTQSVGAVVNPLVGLDTIRRMRGTYFKAFGMVLLIQIVSLILGGVISFVTSPLALPFFGNMPAKFIDGSIAFYFNLVIACVLGLSLFKCGDRLGLQLD